MYNICYIYYIAVIICNYSNKNVDLLNLENLTDRTLDWFYITNDIHKQFNNIEIINNNYHEQYLNLDLFSTKNKELLIEKFYKIQLLNLIIINILFGWN